MNCVLVIDDSRTTVTAISRALEAEGYLVAVADNFFSIPKTIDRYSPQVVILDLNMPALSGEQIGAFLKDFHYQGKIIIYSGERKERLEAAAKAVGAYAYISKEQPLSALLASVKACQAWEPANRVLVMV